MYSSSPNPDGKAPHAATVQSLVERAEIQARLFNAGQMRLWAEHAQIGDDFVLMQPFGGPANHGFDA